jgi:hypothetical protein
LLLYCKKAALSLELCKDCYLVLLLRLLSLHKAAHCRTGRQRWGSSRESHSASASARRLRCNEMCSEMLRRLLELGPYGGAASLGGCSSCSSGCGCLAAGGLLL